MCPPLGQGRVPRPTEGFGGRFGPDFWGQGCGRKKGRQKGQTSICRFYTGYRKTERNERYLTDAISGALEKRLGALDDRIGKLLFKMAVEESMMMRLMAMDESLIFSELEHLRKWAIQTVKKTDGGLNFDDILRIQQ